MEYSFSHSGAACACLIRLAEKRGLPITSTQLIERFRPEYELWADHPGMTDTAMVCDIARQIGLAASVQVLRRYEMVVHCTHHAKVMGVLAFTERFYAPGGHIVPRYDSSLIEEATAGGFRLWTPSLNKEPLVRDYSRQDWDILLAHALVLA